MTTAGAILKSIKAGTVGAPPNGFLARSVAGHPAFMVGRDPSGAASLLISAPGPGRTVPLRLAGIEARFAVPCSVAEPGGPERAETLTAVVCTSPDEPIQAYFANVADLLMEVLGDAPTLTTVADAVDCLVDLFQKLRQPPRKPIAGLVGELCAIDAARDVAAAISAWRADPEERYDFLAGNLRLEVKASATDRRHSASAEQAAPPDGTAGLLASVLVERSGGGTSLEALLAALERHAGDHGAILRLRGIVAATLGRDLPGSLGWRFDMARARSSLSYFDIRGIPALRRPFPPGVSGVRFVSDLETCTPLIPSAFPGLDAEALAILPR